MSYAKTKVDEQRYIQEAYEDVEMTEPGGEGDEDEDDHEGCHEEEPCCREQQRAQEGADDAAPCAAGYEQLVPVLPGEVRGVHAR